MLADSEIDQVGGEAVKDISRVINATPGRARTTGTETEGV